MRSVDTVLSEAGRTDQDSLSTPGPRVTEVPLVGDFMPFQVGPPERVEMNDVLWFSPHPPSIESADVPDGPWDDERPSVAPMALSLNDGPSTSQEPSRMARLASIMNPVLSMGVLGALVAGVYFAQPRSSAIARLALAFPDRVEIDMTEKVPCIDVESLPLAVDVRQEPELAAVQHSVRSPLPPPTIHAALPSVEPPAAEPPSKAIPTPPAKLPTQGPALLPPFNPGDALGAIHACAAAAGGCVGPTGPVAVPVSVTFASTGRVTQAQVLSGPLIGTSEGGCVARTLRSARMDPYAGPPVTVRRTLRLK